MGKILLSGISKKQNYVEYVFSVDDELKPFFNFDLTFSINYYVDYNSLDVASVPDSILAIPFLCCLLPVAWLTNSQITLPCLDKSFYNSITSFKEQYTKNYSNIKLTGGIIVEELEDNKITDNDRTGMFFSSGTETWSNFIANKNEDGDLFTIWGNDVALPLVANWVAINEKLQAAAEQMNRALVVAKSSFKQVIDYNKIIETFSKDSNNNFWLNMQNDFAVLGNCAPASFIRGVSKLYLTDLFIAEKNHLDSYAQLCFSDCKFCCNNHSVPYEQIQSITNYVNIKTDTASSALNRNPKLSFKYWATRIKNFLSNTKIKISVYKLLKNPAKNTIYVIGSPTHNNIGDSGILLAQLHFLNQLGYSEKQIKEITFTEFFTARNIIRKLISPNSLICGLGGGNMGNQWWGEEMFRRHLFNDFPNNPIVIFPQTIHYVDATEKGRTAQDSVASYHGCQKLTLVAREDVSKSIMENLYPQTKVLFTPDIVLSSNMQNFKVVPEKRSGVLFCVRKDSERSIDEFTWHALKTELKTLNVPFSITDMILNKKVTKKNRSECVRIKMQEFCSTKLLITDRLHGMIFAALTCTPAIVFGNYNYKIKGSYKFIKYLPYIRYVDSIAEAKALIPELLDMDICEFDNAPLMPYYENLAVLIHSHMPSST